MLPAQAAPDRARRRLLTRAAGLAGLALTAPDAWLTRLWAQAPCADRIPGELVRTLPLYGAGTRETPLGEMLGGAGLDARLFTDLSVLADDAMVTPADQVYVRTAAPHGLSHDPAAWTIGLGPEGGQAVAGLTAAALAADARPMGAHVMECAGNSNPQNFGLMSAVEWDGVLVSRVLERLPRPPGASGVLISGVDDGASGSGDSQPGASWVFPLDVLDRVAPFLAVRMNGRPLTPDHGAPVRLAVPGWYGCSWIKWVNRIEWVDAEAAATSQMKEFAGRTHQAGVPLLARDYQEPAIDTAAMPVRIEQRRVDGRIEYLVVGIVWGGTRPVDTLVIRFGSRDRGTPFSLCPPPRTHHTWSLWSYRWRPVEPGVYDISLRAADAGVRTRRLDLSFYIRRVRIDDV